MTITAEKSLRGLETLIKRYLQLTDCAEQMAADFYRIKNFYMEAWSDAVVRE